MERFFHNEPEDEFENEDMDHFVKATRNDIMDVMQMELVEQEINERLLGQATEIASSEWCWAFRKAGYKVNRIKRIYQKLKELTIED